jgi:hypothetical protein
LSEARICGVGQRRIGECQEACQNQVALILNRIVRSLCNVGVSHGKRAVALAIQIVAGLADAPDGILSNGFDLAIDLVTGEERDDSFRSALGDEKPPGLTLYNDRKPLALEVEISSHFVYPSVFCGVWRTITSSSGLRMPVSNLLLRNPNSSARQNGFPKASRERSNDMVPVVNVPVLSLQSTSRLPRF